MPNGMYGGMGGRGRKAPAYSIDAYRRNAFLLSWRKRQNADWGGLLILSYCLVYGLFWGDPSVTGVEKCPSLGKEGEDRWRPIVGISPVQRSEATPLITEMKIGIDSVAQVDSMGAVLPGRQYQLTGSCPASPACRGGVKGHNPHRMKLPFREAPPVRAGSFTQRQIGPGRDLSFCRGNRLWRRRRTVRARWQFP